MAQDFAVKESPTGFGRGLMLPIIGVIIYIYIYIYINWFLFTYKSAYLYRYCYNSMENYTKIIIILYYIMIEYRV